MTRAYGRLVVFLGLALGVLLLAPSTAFGHADYERSVPNKNEVVATPPTQIDVFFAQEVLKQEGANYVRVFDDSGTQVSDGDGVVSDDDRTLITAMFPNTLAEGRYIVEWKTLSDGDGDEDSSAFCFFVVTPPTDEQAADCLAREEAEPTAVATTGGATTPVATFAETPSEASPTVAAPSDDEDDSSNTGLIIGIIIAVVVVAGAGAGVYFFMRQRQQG
jgi:methionine-rich copper-binding protein CopC